MKKVRKLAIVAITAAFIAGSVPAYQSMQTVSAHGHGHAAAESTRGGHHNQEHRSRRHADEKRYECDGHKAHAHKDGVCPYSGEEYFECDGHEAHLHEDGVCPYASEE